MTVPGLISILIPFKNASQYLEECLDSILSQSYSQWEVIAIDDHSGDHSLEIVQRYQDYSPKIHCFPNTGDGIIAALQLALKYSRGEFITRMDADDIMPCNKLETLFKLIENRSGHIATGRVEYFPQHSLSEGYKKYENWLNSLTQTDRHFQEIYKECVIPSPCWLIRKTDLLQAGAFNSSKMPEDYDLTFRFYKEKFKVLSTHHLMHHWREHAERTSRTHTNYSIEQFTQLKLDYFLDIELNPDDTLVIWSAGKWGKELANRLLEKKQPFYWVCTNPKMIGNQIYGQRIEDYQSVSKLKNPKLIIPIASPKYQQMIIDFLSPSNLHVGKHLFFFL